MEFSIKGPDPASQHLNGKKKIKYPYSDLHEGEWWGGLGGVIMGKNKFALKCSSGKKKCFKTMFFFFSFLIEKRGIEGQPSQF